MRFIIIIQIVDTNTKYGYTFFFQIVSFEKIKNESYQNIPQNKRGTVREKEKAIFRKIILLYKKSR